MLAAMKHAALGFSLVELMVGMTVGLVVLAAASGLMLSQLSDHRRLSLESRTEQDVRASAEIIGRELRDAGAWGTPGRAFWSEAQPTPMQNPYAGIVISDDGSRLMFAVSHALAEPDPALAEDQVLNANEWRGFKLEAGELRLFNGATWQPLTDRDTLRVQRFRASLTEQQLPMPSLCAKSCGSLSDCPPKVTLRDLLIELQAQAAHDPAVSRSIAFRVRLQADLHSGVCLS
jgi:prepilin-type N-terminal cleavage/methylation domain-containing protein